MQRQTAPKQSPESSKTDWKQSQATHQGDGNAESRAGNHTEQTIYYLVLNNTSVKLGLSSCDMETDCTDDRGVIAPMTYG